MARFDVPEHPLLPIRLPQPKQSPPSRVRATQQHCPPSLSLSLPLLSRCYKDAASANTRRVRTCSLERADGPS
eukprot:1329119-Rhodomonas_salina.3